MSAPILPVLTLREPWASLIIHGPKRIENRTWQRVNLLGRYIGIHASKQRCSEPDDLLLFEQTGRDKPAYGQLLGFCRVDRFVSDSPDEWFQGPIGWLLSDVHAFEVGIEVTGAQGVWDLAKRWEAGDDQHWQERWSIRSECMPIAHAHWFGAYDVLRGKVAARLLAGV